MAKETVSMLASGQKLYSVLRYDRKDIYAIYILALLAGFVQLSLPLGIQTIISFVMAGTISTSIITLIFLVVLGTLMNGILQVRQLQILEKLKQKIFLRFGLEFSSAIPKVDEEKLNGSHLPELVNRFIDTISLQKGLEKLLLDLPAALIQIVFGLLLLSFYHPVFIAFGALLVTIVVLIARFTSPEGFSLALKSSDYKYKVLWWLQETANLNTSFKYSKDDLNVRKADALIAGHLDARTRYFEVLLTQFWSLISFKIVITTAMLVVGTILLVNQKINVGQFIAADIVIIAIIASVEKLILSLDKVYDALVSIEKLNKITGAEREKGGSALPEHTDRGIAVDFKYVNFNIDASYQILNDVSFQVGPGKWALFTGTSGSRKSTILKLLTGSFKKYQGHILIDHQPIGNYNVAALRSQTGVLLSNQELFSGSLWENITMGNSAIKTSDATILAKEIGLLPFIQSHPAGYDMQVNTAGTRMSKHISRKILLVRALIGKPRLLLLEEPFEFLEESEINAIVSLLRKDWSATVLVASENKALSPFFDIAIDFENKKQLS